jgi:hypothetical protein
MTPAQYWPGGQTVAGQIPSFREPASNCGLRPPRLADNLLNK